MLKRLFLEHPRSVGETYFSHLRRAFGFGGRLVLAGLACLIHGLVPGLFARAASDTVTQLHDELGVGGGRTR